MSEGIEPVFLGDLLRVLDPHLSNAARKEVVALQGILEVFHGMSAVEIEKSVRSLKGMMDLFPGSSASEAEKTVRTLLAKSQTGIPTLVERANKVVDGTLGESASQWLADAGKLSVGDLKQLLNGLNIKFSGTKPVIMAFLKTWIESGGKHQPPDPDAELRAKAKEYVGDLAERAKRMDPQTAQEILQVSEKASNDKSLGLKGFKIFGDLLGVPVHGTKKAMADQIKGWVNALLVSRQQTSF